MGIKFAAEVTRLLKSMQGELHLERVPGDKKGRHLELHPSGFPYCPLKQLIPIATHGLFDHRWESPTGDYYCSVGTAVHTVFQKHFGRKAHVVGDWTCRKCGDIAKFSTYEEAGQCCGHNRHYEELGIKFRKTICGHTDALFLYDGEYWLLDYKTSSVTKVTKYLEDGEGLPLKSNVEQVRSYVVLLERQYKIKIKGWALLYLARDNPFATSCVCTEITSDEQRAETQAQMILYDKQYSAMLDVDQNGTGLDFLIRTKPCKTQADYEAKFHDSFNPCPLKDVCFNERKLIKTLGKLVTNSKHLPMRTTKIQEGAPPKPEKPKWVPSGAYLPPKISEF